MAIRRSVLATVTALLAAATAVGCSASPGTVAAPGVDATTAVPVSGGPASGSPVPTPSRTAAAPAPPKATPTSTTSTAGRSPTGTYALGIRTLNLSRGSSRPLRTVVWYPRAGSAGGTPTKDAAPASGRFPLVLFSHGLTASPEAYAPLTTRIAAAGFIVAAPAYPFTSSDAASVDPADLVNQPADGSYVITQVLALNSRAGDLLRGHIDTAHVAAGGHSAGGYTTVGMLSGNTRDSRLKGAIVLSGGSLGGRLGGPATPTLFIHGDKDATVPYATGRSVYTAMTWPKAFLTIVNGDHISSVFGSNGITDVDAKTMIDFLRWTLYNDRAARGRLAGDARDPGATTWESTL